VTSGTFVNPKVGASCDPVDLWYRYYAGYSAGFVEQALQESAATTKLVLDPWNGTGNDPSRHREQERGRPHDDGRPAR
jgi:hypothetical protein